MYHFDPGMLLINCWFKLIWPNIKQTVKSMGFYNFANTRLYWNWQYLRKRVDVTNHANKKKAMRALEFLNIDFLFC